MRNKNNWAKEQKQCERCYKVFFPFVFRKQRFCSHKCYLNKEPWNKGKKVPQNSGPNHYLWVEDRSKLSNTQQRNDSAYKEWRKQVWLRDNYKCKIANPDCNGKIEAHHILGWSQYPELRYEINNGITLCHAHHPRKRSEEAKLSPYFQQVVAEMK